MKSRQNVLPETYTIAVSPRPGITAYVKPITSQIDSIVYMGISAALGISPDGMSSDPQESMAAIKKNIGAMHDVNRVVHYQELALLGFCLADPGFEFKTPIPRRAALATAQQLLDMALAIEDELEAGTFLNVGDVGPIVKAAKAATIAAVATVKNG